ATGKSYLIYPGRNGQYADEKHHGHDGGYQDVFVKTAGGWRFKERVHVHPPQIPGEYKGVPNDQLDAASATAAPRNQSAQLVDKWGRRYARAPCRLAPTGVKSCGSTACLLARAISTSACSARARCSGGTSTFAYLKP